MKFLAKRSKLLFALMPLIAIIFYALTFSPSLKAALTFKPVNKVNNIIELKDLPSEGTPADYSPLENIAIANKVLFTASYFQGVANGGVNAKVGFINYDQKVYNIRKVKDGALFSQAISTSSLKSVAEQKYVSGDTYLYRPGSKIKDTSAEWGGVYEMSADSYMLKYGMPPFELCKYVINESTLLEAKLLSFPAGSEGDYVYGLTLDPTLSTEYYQNEVRTLSGSSSEYPKFESVYLEITMGSDWRVRQIYSSETYWIDKPVKAVCTATLTEVFDHINDSTQTVPEAEPFLSFVPKDDGGDYVPPKDPTDYLAAAFGKYIQGEPLYLNCDISLPAQKLSLNVKLSIDLATKYADVRIEDGLYIGYRGDRVYFEAGGLKGFLSTEKFAELAPELLAEAKNVSPKIKEFIEKFDFGALQGDGLMELLFADAEIIETEEVTVIAMPFMISGVNFDIRMNLSPKEPYEFRSIDAKISILTVGADVTVAPCGKPEMPSIDESYADLTAAADFLLPAVRTAGYQSYTLRLNGNFASPIYSDALSGSLTINRDGTLSGGLRFEAAGTDVSVTYICGSAYLSIGGVRVKASAEQLAGAVSALLPGGTDLSGLDLNKILSAIHAVTVENNTLTGVLSINGVDLTLSLKHNGDVLTALTLSSPEIDGTGFRFSADLNVSDTAAQVTVPEGEYMDYGEVEAFIGPVLRLINGSDYALTVDAGLGGHAVTGTISMLRKGTLTAQAALTMDGEPLTVTYIDGELYVAFGSLRLKGVEGIRALAALFGADGGDAGAWIAAAAAALDSVSVEGNTLRIGLKLGADAITAEITRSETAIESLRVTGSVLGTPLDASLRLRNDSLAVIPPEGEFTDAAAAVPHLKAIRDLMQNEAYAIALTADVASANFKDTLDATMILNKDMTATGVLRAAGLGLTADIALKENTVFLSLGSIRFKLDLSDVPALAALFPSGENSIDVIQTLASLTLTAQEGALRASIRLNGVPLELTLRCDDGLPQLRLAVNTDGLAVDASLAIRPARQTDVTVSGDYADLAALISAYKTPVKNLMTAGEIRFDLHNAAVNGLPLTGSVRALKSGNAYSVDVRLTYDGVPVSLRITDGCVYLAAGELKLTGRRKELPALITRAAAAFGFPLETPSFDLGSVGTLLDMIDSLAYTDGELRAEIAAKDFAAKLTVTTDGNNISLQLRGGNKDITAEIGMETAYAATGDPVETPEGYTELASAVTLLEASAATAAKDGFRLNGTAQIAYQSLNDTLAYNLTVNRDGTLQAAFTLETMGISGTLTKTAEGMYLDSGLFKLKLPMPSGGAKAAAAASAIPDFILQLLPQELLQALSGAPVNARTVTTLLPCLKAFSVTDSGASLVVDTGRVILRLDTVYGVELVSGTVGLTVLTEAAETLLTARIDAALSAGESVTVVLPEGDYKDVALLSPLEILDGLSLTSGLSANVITNDGKNVRMDGTLTVSIRNFRPELALQVTAFDTDVALTLYENVLYVRVGDMRLNLDRDTDEAAFIAFIKENLPPFIGDFLESFLALDIEGMLGRPVTGGTGGPTADEIYSAIDLTDGFRYSFTAGSAAIAAGLPFPINGTVSEIFANVYVNETTVLLRMTEPALSRSAPDLTPVFADTYVSMLEFAAFLPPLKNTVTADGFELTASGDVHIDYTGSAYITDASGKAVQESVTDPVTGKTTITFKTAQTQRSLTIKQGSAVRIVPEGVLGAEGYFLNVEAALTLEYYEEVVGVGQAVKGRTVTDALRFTLVREPTGKNVYVDYNGTKMKLSYEEVMGMLGYAKDILGLPDGTILDDLTDGYYNKDLDTSIFDSMDLKGLDSIKASLVEALDTVQRGRNVIIGDGTRVGALKAIGNIMNAATLRDALDNITAITAALKENGFGSNKTDDDIIDSFGAALRAVGKASVSFGEGLLTIRAPYEETDADGNPVPTDKIQSIALSHDGGRLSTLHINSFTFGSIAMDGRFSLRTNDPDYTVNVTAPAGSDQTFNSDPNAAERSLWNDFGSVRNLFEDLIHTANLKKFHIGGANNTEYGTIKLVIPEVIGINMSVTVDIPFVLKVDLQESEPGVWKPLVYLRLNTMDVGTLYTIAVSRAITQMYFYDNTFLFTRTTENTQLSTPDWNDTTYWTKTEYVKVTTEQLLKKTASGDLDIDNLMKYVYFMLPLSGTVQSPINDAIQAGITTDFSNKGEILNRFSYNNGNYSLGLDIGELSRIDDIDDLTVTINTKTSDGVSYINNLLADISFLYGTTGIAQGIQLRVDGYLVNPGSPVGNISYYDYTRPNDDCPASLNGWLVQTHYHRDGVYSGDISDIPAMIEKLNGGTIDSPYYREKNT